MIQKHAQKTYRKKSSKGFTLVELIVTVAILSFGIVTIYEALFISMDTYGYYVNYLETQDWINEKIAEKNNELAQVMLLEIGETSGQIVRNQKTFNWTVIVSFINEEQNLYRVNVTLFWKQAGKKVKTSRVAYLLPPQLKAYEESLV